MRGLANKILLLLAQAPYGLALRQATKLCGQDIPHTRSAFDEIEAAGHGRIVRRGKGGAVFLVPASSRVFACAVCKREFARNRGSKRVTCSRSCHSAHGWRDPGAAAKRGRAISAALNTPEGKARMAAHNKRRWADPKQRAALAEQNRRQWKDPEKAAIRAAKIRINNQSPEFRAHLSKVKKEHWADPVLRKKMTEAVNASEAVKLYRKNFGEFLKKRWADPKLRAKYIAANKARNKAKADKARMQREGVTA